MHRTVEIQFIGRTYDDFLFRPQAGVVASRRGIALRTRLSRRLSLELPVASANMDSVTGSQMAKAMALEGGIGFVHRGMPIAAQVESVARVKRTHSYVVEQPLCLPRGTTIREVRNFTAKHNITGILIEETRGSGTLAGLPALDVPTEGQEIQIPHKGSVLDILHRIRGHLRSAVRYTGEETLVAARTKVLPDPLQYLIPLSPAAQAESYER